MLVAFPSHQGDVAQLNQLLRWIGQLDGQLNHDALLCFDAGTSFDAAMEAQQRAEKVFRDVRMFSTEQSVKGWPHAPNVMFRAIAKYVQEHWPQPFLLCEPDVVPLKPGWLDELEAEHKRREWTTAMQFMGCITPCTQPMMPERIMSGVAVYPSDTANRIPPTLASGRAWQVDAAEIMVRDGSHTPLIKDFFGQRDLPPVFVESRRPDSPAHHFTLDWLPEGAVLFHRDKTHSLMPLLAKRLGIEWAPQQRKVEKICVVFPVHGGDISLALHHSMWLRKLGQRWDHPAIIAFDATAIPTVNQLRSFLEPLFQSVEMFQYPHFAGTYPHTANFAFQSVAHRMAQGDAPWFWCEPDLVVLKASWLEQLQAEYEQAQKSWMGPVVPNMGHLQGTSIYPADAAHRMPRAMACGAGQAFDMEMKEETLHDRHDCGHLLHHVWSILNDAPCPVGGGVVPGPITAEQARRWLPREAVATHRWKSRHLIDLLLTGQYQH